MEIKTRELLMNNSPICHLCVKDCWCEQKWVRVDDVINELYYLRARSGNGEQLIINLIKFEDELKKS